MAIDIQQINDAGFLANCYYCSDGKTQLVIDPSVPPTKEHKAFAGNSYVLATHLHFDHIFYAEAWQKLDNVKFWMSAADLADVSKSEINASTLTNKPQSYKLEATLEADLARIQLSPDIEIEVIETPGHTKGSVCLLLMYCGQNIALFSGDTIFDDSVGRTDLPGGSTRQLYNSLCELKHRLTKLSPDLVIYPGHGEPFTVAEALHQNPWLTRLEAKPN